MKQLILIPFCLTVITLFAGNDNFPVGARSAGLAHASVTLSDAWSTYHNQAGLSLLKKPTAAAFYETRFLLSELSTKAIAGAIPFKKGAFGLSVMQSGFSLYSESKIGLAYGMQLSEIFSAGIQLDYFHINIGESYGSKGALAGEAGVLAKLTDNLAAGVHVANPTRTKLSDNESLPTTMRLGLAYHFSKKVFVSAESQKNSGNKPVFKAGIEYHVIEALYLRSGISTNPTLNTFGFGLHIKNLKFDFAGSFHSVLGFSPQVGISYDFGADEN